ncbi:hypothetical protein T281_14970 [Rhodomicrobium udaipurense JA643]|uniref:Uncharacterized protein n=1 Tax=Rhodomicrobium udaipurense TaxID=1202716 RepID=A0A8I1GCG2_9HYPH|nr:hypothetical protein [Rhodomicrobium udaipurense]KAI93722.1 hypothetical protein T281_14970 [Rhodomicrobium udaipurense JA643]MBJ7542339.1 hypothetical protein [Rhodomicrobium udaipurense]
MRSELDAPREIAAAAAWLASDAPPTIQGCGGDNQTFKIAAELVRDRALTPETALDLMLEHYNPRCEPPWLPADLHKKVHSAAGSARGDIGTKTAEGMFGGVVAVPPRACGGC